MKKEYGAKKGKGVFYASIVKGKKGTEKWAKEAKGSKIAKAKKTFSAKKFEKGRKKYFKI